MRGFDSRGDGVRLATLLALLLSPPACTIVIVTPEAQKAMEEQERAEALAQQPAPPPAADGGQPVGEHAGAVAAPGALDASQAQAQTTPQAQPPAHGTPQAPVMPHVEAPPPKSTDGLTVTSGDYTWKLDGYIKVDLIHDFDEIGSTDSFDPRTIPTTGVDSGGGNTRLHAKQTRLNLDVRGKEAGEDELHGFVEVDFFDSGNSLRMRHAYGEMGPILAGQTWSTFMDEKAMPETLDFESPIAFPQVRQAQVRYTQPMNDEGDYFAVALEDPDSDAEGPAGVPGVDEEAAPDLAARVHWKNPLGHVQLGLFGGYARFDPDVGGSDSTALWGLNLSTKLAAGPEDKVFGQVTYGDGVGRYRGGIVAAPDSSGDLEAIPVLAFMAAYEHHWSDEYRSTLTYSWGDGNLPGGAAVTDTQELTYAAANLIWQYSKRAYAGVEFLHGMRETFDDESGDANRIQFALRYDL